LFDRGILIDLLFCLLIELDIVQIYVEQLYETYHGVYVNVQYSITATMNRGMMSSALKKSLEFIVEIPTIVDGKYVPKPLPFEISPETLQNIRQSNKAKVPDFLVKGNLDSDVFCVDKPMTGELTVKKCSVEIRSIELQLVRVETTAYAEGEVREGLFFFHFNNSSSQYIDSYFCVFLQRLRFKIFNSLMAMCAAICQFRFI
jgi:hypothetical protein